MGVRSPPTLPSMTLTLLTGEPAAGPWRVEPVGALVRLLAEAAGPVQGRPCIVAVDGRGGSGKSTLAAQLQAAAPRSAVVHTDDVAWHHSYFDWTDLLACGVLGPLRRAGGALPPAGLAGQGPARRHRGAHRPRPGPGRGIGAGRRELAGLLDEVVWVQSDAAEAERQGIARDVAAGTHGDADGATRFWHEWMAQELPFVADQRTWERADVVTRGTSTASHDPARVVLAPPVGQGSAPRA